jgi:uncharacterized phage protein (TIGR02220 family)
MTCEKRNVTELTFLGNPKTKRAAPVPGFSLAVFPLVASSGKTGAVFWIFMTGYISLHRKIQQHWLWNKKPFSYGQAWTDMIMLANHKSAKIAFNGKIIEIQRGCFLTSQEKLKKRWGWKRSYFDLFFSLLKQDGMILIENRANQGTYVTICKYDSYNNRQQTERQTKDQTVRKRSANEGAINNNVNNEKKDNNSIVEIIDYLNQKTGSSFKANTKNTQSFINARLKEGFAIDNFKTVIDKKTVQWLSNPDMAIYLRPQTLFGTKFESYLNEREQKQQKLGMVY